MKKRLYRSNNRMIFGVCGGIGDYFNIDPVIIRLALVILTLVSRGTGIIAYIIAVIVMPPRPFSDEDFWQGNYRNANEHGKYADGYREKDERDAAPKAPKGPSDDEFDSYFKK